MNEYIKLHHKILERFSSYFDTMYDNKLDMQYVFISSFTNKDIVFVYITDNLHEKYYMPRKYVDCADDVFNIKMFKIKDIINEVNRKYQDMNYSGRRSIIDLVIKYVNL